MIGSLISPLTRSGTRSIKAWVRAQTTVFDDLDRDFSTLHSFIYKGEVGSTVSPDDCSNLIAAPLLQTRLPMGNPKLLIRFLAWASAFSIFSITVDCVEVPRVEDMTLAEKIGQMAQIDKVTLGDGEALYTHMLGAIVSGGGAAPEAGNAPGDWADMVDLYQRQANRTRLRIPVLHGIDAIHGHNIAYGATVFPHHIGIGAAHSPDLARAVGAAAAREVAATGIRWAFAPTVAVCRDARWGRCYETFGESTALVQSLVSEVEGWQAKPDSASSGDSDPAGALKGSILVAATAKHFIADGGTWGGRDEGDARISEEELRRVHLPPYREAVARGVASVMVSYSSWNGAKMHKNRRLLTGVLKGELGFAGVLVSDWEAVQRMGSPYHEQLEAAINAGLDMIMLPRDYVQFIDTLTSLVRAGRVAEARVDDAVRRILALKQSLGLFEDPYTLRSMAGLVGCPAHRELARRAVRESLVLVKNEKRAGGGSMFPLPLQGKKVLVAGTHAHNLGWQCGAWTINWQGWSGNNRTVGTTILQGIEHYAAALGGAVEFAENPAAGGGGDGKFDASVAGGSGGGGGGAGDSSSEDRAAAAAAAGATAAGTVAAAEADYGIVVVGERTYAERFGDDTVLQLYEAGRAAVRSVCARMPCVVVLVSGRPLDVREWLPHVDALVAAWLPGTEGLGVADVLFGEHDFTGRLPLTWFREAAQLPMPPGGANYDPLFPYGYGLNKAAEVLLESGVESRSGDVRVATS